MAATAHPPQNLEAQAPDVMDLHSDSGLDFGDGDIELDLDPAPLAHPDDVSIKDVATEIDEDPQTAPADTDDFMADHEDLIEEDHIYYGDETVAEYASINDSTTAHEEAPAPLDEDLIDYSDDEDQHGQGDQAASLQQMDNTADDHDDRDDVRAEDTSSNVATHEIADSSAEQTLGQLNAGENETGFSLNDEEYPHTEELEANNVVDLKSDNDDGGVLLQQHELQSDEDDPETTFQEQKETQELQPIAVNYEGNELWLFKQHDTEDTGDWLLEDTSVVHTSMSDLFRACRSALGEDISHETELGLRFDHLHSMELYEDNTACVAVSLERLMQLYQTLHSQDGNDNPEAFYMCLLSRPRFATLLADVAKHAEQGSGFSGLNTAIAAGETNFTDVYSGHSTEHEVTEWDNEDDEEEEQETRAQTESESDEHEIENEGREVQDEDEHDSDEAEQQPEELEAEHNSAVTPEDHVYTKDDGDHDEDEDEEAENNSTSQADADNNEETSQHSDGAEIAETASHSGLQHEQDEYEIVDAHDIENVGNGNEKPVESPSPSPSTVQGDGSTTSPKDVMGDNQQQNIVTHEKYENESNSKVESQTGDDPGAESYQDYVEAYDEEDPFKGLHADDTEGFTADGNFEDYDDQDYGGYNFEGADQPLQEDYTNGTEYDGHDVDNAAGVENEFGGSNDFLDLSAPEWAADQDASQSVGVAPTMHEEEEDGGLEQPVVAASSAAYSVAASSADVENLSAQGQKRSIDEVGDVIDLATDSTDTKRPRV